jgi:hypothetical protein
MRDPWRCRLLQEDLVHSTPLKIIQQLLQPRLHAIDVDVMTESGLAANALDTRLTWIDFPRMEIEDRRLSVFIVDVPKHPP